MAFVIFDIAETSWDITERYNFYSRNLYYVAT